MHSSSQVTPSLVAIVDDDSAVRAALGNLLKSIGYRILGFASGEEFLASPHLADIGCAVFDIKLKGISGFELQERLAATRPDIALPVIFITGFGDAAMRERALRAGAVAFLRKPVDVDALLGQLHDVLNGADAAT